MKRWSLHVASFALLLAGIGCAGGSAPKTVTVPSCTPSSTPELAYVLSYPENTVSMYTVNSCTGDLTPTTPATVATGGNQFGAEGLAVDPSGRFAYVANLMSNASDLATVAMFTIDSSTGVLSPTTPPTVPTGYFPQGIAIDPLGRFVYTANSDDNTISMFTINASTGVLTPTTPAAVGAGWSPGFVTVDPSGKFAYASNQDDDTVSMYTINSSTGILTPTTPATVQAGSSPFGVTVDPSGKFAYVPYAYSQPNNFVWQFTIDPVTGLLTPNTPPVISAGNSPTSVAVDPTSKFAYVTNQNSASVSIYTLNGNGTLTAAGTAATGSGPIWIAITGPKQ